MSVGEIFTYELNESLSSFKYYGSCNIWEQLPLSLGIHFVLMIFCVLFTFGIQIALIFKQRQLKEKRESGIMVITYDEDGVTISRRSADKSLGHKLINFNRTVVSPKASFLVFLSNVWRACLHVLLYSIEGTSYPSIVSQFAVYVEFCVLFFLFTLIETYFSPQLLTTIIDYIPWHRRAYTVNV